MGNKEVKNETLGQVVRARRQSLGMSLADAAAASSLHHSYWSYLENGKYQTPAPGHLQTIAGVLDLPIEDLYNLAGYGVPSSLPSFTPYLRAKYDLPPEAIGDLERYFEMLRNHYGIPKDQPVFPPKPKANKNADEKTEKDTKEQDRRAA